MAKTEHLQIRLTESDRDRLRRVADAEHLDLSTWARRVLLIAVAEWEQDESRRSSGQTNA